MNNPVELSLSQVVKQTMRMRGLDSRTPGAWGRQRHEKAQVVWNNDFKHNQKQTLKIIFKDRIRDNSPMSPNPKVPEGACQIRNAQA